MTENENDLNNGDKKATVNDKKDILFVLLFAFCVLMIAVFNYVVDPYYIFRNTTIKGLNNIKTHQFSNRRSIIYSDIKMHSKNKDIVFTGNCMLTHSDKENVAFFTVPIVKFSEVAEVIKNLIQVSPDLKTIYWGMFFDDFWNEDIQDSDKNVLPDTFSKNLELQDFVNLFFSYNTTKYSLETVKNSMTEQDVKYIYPYREIAFKHYDTGFSLKALKEISEVCDFAKQHNINLVLYYSPIHVTKKMHIYSKGQWQNFQKTKLELAKIADFYDYSLFNEYNSGLLDANSKYYTDNVHFSVEYNDIIVNDILSDNKQIGVLITKDNVENVTAKDSLALKDYIEKHKSLYTEIKNLTDEDRFVRIKKEI